jgi:hypothetical protein
VQSAISVRLRVEKMRRERVMQHNRWAMCVFQFSMFDRRTLYRLAENKFYVQLRSSLTLWKRHHIS